MADLGSTRIYGDLTFTGNVIGNGSGLTNLVWGNIDSKPATATRWPNWNEVGSKPALGTAAYADLTTSPTDTTYGRAMDIGNVEASARNLLANGSYGLGGKSISAPIDLNDLKTNGFYSYYGTNIGGLNSPTSLNGNIITSLESVNFGMQIASVNADPSSLYTRNLFNGTWKPWRKIYDQSSILGTVSQSGGVPSGAIIERGSNANGEYVKFADGTLIMRKSGASTGTLAVSAVKTFPFPIDTIDGSASNSMSVRDTVNGHGEQNIQLIAFTGTTAQNTSNQWLLRNNSNSYFFSIVLELLAIGRWY